MKTMKKLVAILLAAVMVMALYGVSFAEDLPKADIKIVGLDSNDVVTLYRIISWDTTVGNWAVGSNYTSVGTSAGDFQTMNSAKAEQLAAIANAADVVTGGSITGDTYTANVEPGMYLALVKAGGENVYNPMILSVNWDGTSVKGSELSGIDSSEAYGSTGLAKKSPVDLTKTVKDTGADATATVNGDTYKTVTKGDVIPFEVTSTVPAYADNYTDPYYGIKDAVSTGLTLKTDSIKVTVGGTVIIENGAKASGHDADFDKFEATTNGYDIQLSATFLHGLTSNAEIKIEYTATVGDLANGQNVTRLNNKATVEFSNNPSDMNDHGKVVKKTNHYVFAIDAGATGKDGGTWVTSEFVKVAKSENGEPINEWLVTNTGSWTSAQKLAGATFRLVGKAGTTTEGYTATAQTGDDGLISFYNLEAGEYVLTETAAPAGYVKSDEEITVKIEATFENITTQEDGVTVTEEVLKEYKIFMNGALKDTYTVENSGTNTVKTSEAAAGNVTHPFVNTQGMELPTTGGIGTTIFYVSGIVLVLGAAAILVARRKADAE